MTLSFTNGTRTSGQGRPAQGPARGQRQDGSVHPGLAHSALLLPCPECV